MLDSISTFIGRTETTTRTTWKNKEYKKKEQVSLIKFYVEEDGIEKETNREKGKERTGKSTKNRCCQLVE